MRRESLSARASVRKAGVDAYGPHSPYRGRAGEREVGKGERAMVRGKATWSGLEGPGNHGKEMKPRQ